MKARWIALGIAGFAVCLVAVLGAVYAAIELAEDDAPVVQESGESDISDVGNAATLTVDSTADDSDFSTADGFCDTDDGVDDGPCTLRAAIEQANFDVGTDTIEFSIAGGGPHTITPASALPIITAPVVIDGYSQAGATANTNALSAGSNAVLMIVLDGTSAGAVDGLNISAGSSTVKGLVINRFGQDGIELVTNGGNTIEGNFIGTDSAGAGPVELGNTRYGVYVNLVPDNTIGGTTSAARNVISNSDSFGVRILGHLSTGNKVEGNYIGTDATGTLDRGNKFSGVIISGAPNNTIGGTTSAARNLISGNSKGVSIVGVPSTGNKVEGNYIGTDATGTTDLGNSGHGVLIDDGPLNDDGASNNTIGGTVPGAANIIAFNDDGVRVEGATTTGNTITGNSIHDNSGLGINNVSGGNTELAPPIVTAVSLASGTSSCLLCAIEVFEDADDEGETFLGTTTTDAGSGDWSFLGAVTGPNITATVTDDSGNTSEFSQPRVDLRRWHPDANPDTDADRNPWFLRSR